MPISPHPTPLYPWGRCPCDHCGLAMQCKARLEACTAFARYLDGAPEREWSKLPRAPRRELFVRILGPVQSVAPLFAAQ
jgi:hypothetical protein